MALKRMGNLVTYRPAPLKIFNSEEGSTCFYAYGANQITGWRNSQEDRYICLPNFYEDLSMFAVYDGHGGEEVSQYLRRFLHQNIIYELKEHKNDIELALYLGFLTADCSLRNITDEELSLIEGDVEKEFTIPDRSERRRVISKFANMFPSVSAGSSKDSFLNQEGAVATVASACLKTINEDPKCSEAFKKSALHFLLQAPLAPEDDMNDEDFIEEAEDTDDDIKEVSIIEEEEEDDDDDDDDIEEISNEDDDDDKEISTNKEAEDNKNEYCIAEESNEGSNSESANNSGSDEDQEMDISSGIPENQDNLIEDHVHNENAAVNSTENKPVTEEISSDHENNEDDACNTPKNVRQNLPKKNPKPKIGFACGSTATVVILDTNNVYIANVGDSRCVACINGEAVDLSVDHKPTDEEEYLRIRRCNSFISEDGRVEGGLDMSRAFGDFGLKNKDAEEPHQPVICVPDIKKVNLSGLEFIIIASDGIWNTMNSEKVISVFKMRLKSEMELRDICAELFEEMLPSDVTEDGSGCDNMTAILIVFKEGKEEIINFKKEIYQYAYKFGQYTDSVSTVENAVPEDVREVLPEGVNNSTHQVVEQKHHLYALSTVCDNLFYLTKHLEMLSHGFATLRSKFKSITNNMEINQHDKSIPSTSKANDYHISKYLHAPKKTSLKQFHKQFDFEKTEVINLDTDDSEISSNGLVQKIENSSCEQSDIKCVKKPKRPANHDKMQKHCNNCPTCTSSPRRR